MTSTCTRASKLALVLAVVVLLAPPFHPGITATQPLGNGPPVAEAGPNLTANVGNPVRFDASKSYDPDLTGGWTSGPHLPTARGQPAGAVVGEEFYVIGGHRSDLGTNPSLTDLNEVLDTGTSRWQTRSPLPSPREQVGGLGFERHVRVYGGGGNGRLLDLVDEYNPSNNSWSQLNTLPRGEKDVVAASMGRDIYVWITAQQELWVQPNGAGRWTQLASPPPHTVHARIAILGYTLYLVGWSDRPAPGGPVLLAYDSFGDAWTSRKPPAFARCEHGVVPFRGLLVVVAGETCAGQSGFVAEGEVYDPRTDAWSTIPRIPTPRDGFAIGVAGDCIYTAGGDGVDFYVQYNVTEVYCARLRFDWDFGDGIRGGGESTGHTYSAPGTYTVRLTVTDPLGAQGHDALTVTVLGNRVSPRDLKHEAIQRIKALKEQALARGDGRFLHELDEAEEEVWESLGFEHPFRPDSVTAVPAPDVTARGRDHDKVRLTLGPSWDTKLPSYTTLRLTWSNGVVTVINLPAKWPDKHGDLRARPWFDAWHQDIRIHTERDTKSETATLDVHAHEASMGFRVSLDTDRVADLSFTYEMRHLWVDATHLDPKHGKKVFDEEKDAVKELVCLTGKKDHHDDGGDPNASVLWKSGDDDEHKRCHGEGHEHGGPTPTVVCRGLDPRNWTGTETAALDTECDLIANLLVKADEVIALTALEDARNTPIKNPKNANHVAREIEKAEKELAMAYREWDGHEYDDAIQRFKQAWKHAQRAIEMARR